LSESHKVNQPIHRGCLITKNVEERKRR